MVQISSYIVLVMPTAEPTVGSDISSADVAKVLSEDGCVVIADVASPQTMDQMRAELEPYLAATVGGNTDFLAETTQRPAPRGAAPADGLPAWLLLDRLRGRHARTPGLAVRQPGVYIGRPQLPPRRSQAAHGDRELRSAPES